MQLVNLTSGTVLAEKLMVARDFKNRLTGLIGRTGLNQGEALILLPCKSIHTFFMTFPIDVIFLSRESVVLRVMENLKPFRFSPVVPRSFAVVELPEGSLSATGTRAGHILQVNL
ncbi:MAG: DUF192 domain-containing protein [Pelotomaculum sp.]|uniref:Uncharacterized conserved protein n=1 Tax=Pelotomaculum thermopropionicum (strain DSM 13744 / JCM 10971 / SI) TaxID=370438 RepID=A5D292_PELTS|nr:DUF192 domain-containing protein [Pelotomaculum sp.]BAF59635.1 uncharacterized conserved protein [Pelotomaculum thermopropionicum SI]